MSDLGRLRDRIRQIDAELLELVAERMETAKSIGRHKKQEGVPLRDWNVERQVLDNAEELAGKLDLPPQAVRSLMQSLIAASRDEQERLSYSDYRGEAENILIIGGAGKMGRWFADFFGNQGHRVNIFDPSPVERAAADQSGQTLPDALHGTSCAVIAAPIAATPGVIDEIVAAGYRGTVFDIASLKSLFKPAIQRARRAGLAVTSIHPMFGPGARTLSDQVVCICDCGDDEAAAKVAGFFADTAATIVRLSFDEHDRIISYVLGLSHLANIVFTKVLMAGGLSFEEINRVGSTTFHSQMTTTATVIQENPDLYFEIQKLNPYSVELRDSFLRELQTISDWIRDGDDQAFRKMMFDGRKWMAKS